MVAVEDLISDPYSGEIQILSVLLEPLAVKLYCFSVFGCSSISTFTPAGKFTVALPFHSLYVLACDMLGAANNNRAIKAVIDE
jgi:hypothetical protein